MEGEASKRRRVELLDTLRGLALIHMVLFHTAYDLVYLFGVTPSPFLRWFMGTSVICTAAFVFLAGITVRFSRSAATHGARLLLIAAGFTLVTAFVFPGSAIYFGALHLIATGMLVYGALSNFFNRIPWWVGLILSAFIFAATYNADKGVFGFGQLSVNIPEQLTLGSMMYPFGFIDHSFSSVDFLPVLPWLFLFLCGVFIGKPVVEKKLPEFAYRDFCPPVTWLGRNSLIIYVLHQPIVFCLLYIIFEIILKK